MKKVSRKISIHKDKCLNLFLSNSKHDFRFYEIILMRSLAYLTTKMSYMVTSPNIHIFKHVIVVLSFHTDSKLPCLMYKRSCLKYELEFMFLSNQMNNSWQRFNSFMDALRDILEER
jgi:hypothetical protein